jgi:hypothetical protein
VYFRFAAFGQATLKLFPKLRARLEQTIGHYFANGSNGRKIAVKMNTARTRSAGCQPAVLTVCGNTDGPPWTQPNVIGVSGFMSIAAL